MHLKSGLPSAVNLGLFAVYVYSYNDGLIRIIGPTLIIYYEIQWALCCRIGVAMLLSVNFLLNFFFIYKHKQFRIIYDQTSPFRLEKNYEYSNLVHILPRKWKRLLGKLLLIYLKKHKFIVIRTMLSLFFFFFSLLIFISISSFS